MAQASGRGRQDDAAGDPRHPDRGPDGLTAAPGTLAGRVAVVTGASRGIGLAISRALDDLGAEVLLPARPSEHLDRACAELSATALPAGLTDPGSVRAAFAEVERRQGRLDVLVDNAAISGVHLIEEAGDAELAAEVGPVHTIRGAVPLLRKAPGRTLSSCPRRWSATRCRASRCTPPRRARSTY